MFRFEKLDVWNGAIELADDVYRVMRLFPDDEKPGLTSQMRRAVVSISSNIAERSGRSTNRDFMRFIELACGSLMELISPTYVAQRQTFLVPDDVTSLRKRGDKVARMLSSLRASLERLGAASFCSAATKNRLTASRRRQRLPVFAFAFAFGLPLNKFAHGT